VVNEVKTILPIIEPRIYLIRGYRVMVDTDLAGLYDVSTIRLNEQVRRNRTRFPQDFMFQLSQEEAQSLRSQFAISKIGRGGRRYLPYVFTEHGVAMLSSVLKSQRAVEMGIAIVRAFIKLREMLATHKDLAYKMEELEREQKNHGENLVLINLVLKKLMKPKEAELKPANPIGFNK
jgi:hypothetical protein